MLTDEVVTDERLWRYLLIRGHVCSSTRTCIEEYEDSSTRSLLL